MTGLLSTPAAGLQASNSPDTSPEAEQAQEAKPLTIADVERIAEEKATRIAQSMVDKAEHRISKKAQEQIAAIDLTRQSLGLTDEQVEQAKQKVIYQDLTSPRQQEQASTPPPAQQVQAQTEIDPVIAETLDVFKAEGVTIEVGDPEYKPLDAILKDPNGNIHQYRKELFKQIEVKRARVAANQQQAPARVISGGQPNQSGGAITSSAHDAWQEAYKK